MACLESETWRQRHATEETTLPETKTSAEEKTPPTYQFSVIKTHPPVAASNNNNNNTNTTSTQSLVVMVVGGVDCVSRQFNRSHGRKFNVKRLRQKCCAALLQCDSLTSSPALTLNLNDLELNDRHAAGLSSVFSDLNIQPYTTTLNLSDNRFLVPGARKLASSISSMLSLRTLNISGNRSLGPVGCAAICDAALTSGVVTLKMRDTSLCQFHFDLGVKQVSNLIQESMSLQTLDLSFNCLRPLQFAIVCRGVEKRSVASSSLRVLNLSNNPIGDAGVKLLTQSIRASSSCGASSSLTTLILDECNIQAEGATALAALIRDGYLLTLRMSSNSIGDKGYQSLAKSVAPCYGETCSHSTSGIFGARLLLIPPCSMSCSCRRLSTLVMADCRSGELGHNYYKEQLGHAMLMTSLVETRGWRNTSLVSLILRREEPRAERLETVGYVPLESDRIMTLLCSFARKQIRLPQEIVFVLLTYLAKRKERTIALFPVTVH